MQFFTDNKIAIAVAVIIVLAGVLSFSLKENGELSPDTQAPLSGAEEAGEEGKVSTPTTAPITAPISVLQQVGDKGRLVFAIQSTGNLTDKTESALVTLKSILIHNTKAGWVTLQKDPKVYDLLLINKDRKPELVLDLNVGVGNYDRLWLLLGGVVLFEGNIATPIKSISDELNIPFSLKVEKDKISAITFSFIVDKSIHTTIDDIYLFAPVFSVNSLSQVSTIQKSGSKVEIFDGITQFIAKLGVDLNGNTKINYSISSSFLLDLVQDVLVAMPRDIDRTNLDISAGDAINIALLSKRITKVTSVQLASKDKIRIWQVFEETGNVSKSVFVDAMTGKILSVE